jgi:hypothetical protein
MYSALVIAQMPLAKVFTGLGVKVFLEREEGLRDDMVQKWPV